MQEQTEDYSDRSWLLDRMSRIFPDTCKLGICYGLSAMRTQANLSNDIETFDRRLKLIKKIPLENFAQEIERLTTKRIELINKVKQEIGEYRELSSTEKAELMQQPEIQKGIVDLEQLIETLIQEGKDFDDKEKELNKRKNSYLFNAFTQKKINEQVQFSEDESIKLDIPAFLSGIQLYQDFDHYKHLIDNFPEEMQQDIMLTSPLIASKQIELKGGFCKNEEFSSVYKMDELTESFNLFNQIAQEQGIKKPIAFIIENVDHAICVDYDPVLAQWSFTNAAKLPTLYTKNPRELAQLVLEAHGTEYLGVLSTDLFYNQSDKTEWESVISLWKNHARWQEIHKTTKEKAQERDPKQNSWLSLATRKRNYEQVQKLMQFKTQEEEPVHSTPLYWAVVIKDTPMVQYLIENGENPNQKNLNREFVETPLLAAAKLSRNEEAEILIQAGAEVNCVSENFYGVTPLHFAVHKGNHQLANLLMTHGAKSTQRHDGATPLYLAAKNNDIEMVRLLLQITPDVTEPCYSNSELLLHIAKNYDKEKEMEHFIKSKLQLGESQPDFETMCNLMDLGMQTPWIAITAKEIAEVLGFKDIVAEINFAEECILKKDPYHPKEYALNPEQFFAKRNKNQSQTTVKTDAKSNYIDKSVK